MRKFEFEIKEFSTKKLKEIVEEQSNAYSERFIDVAKNELIKRGETFVYDDNLKKLVKELSDDDLKTVVEKERADYNLEYMELAIGEYLARGFKNDVGYTEINAELEDSGNEKSFPALRNLGEFYRFVGVVSFIIIPIIFVSKIHVELIILLIALCTIYGTVSLAISEGIKVILAIEENTRRGNL